MGKKPCEHVIWVPMILLVQHALSNVIKLAHSPIKTYWIMTILKPCEHVIWVPMILLVQHALNSVIKLAHSPIKTH